MVVHNSRFKIVLIRTLSFGKSARPRGTRLEAIGVDLTMIAIAADISMMIYKDS